MFRWLYFKGGARRLMRPSLKSLGAIDVHSDL
jgi:hypothetical protein